MKRTLPILILAIIAVAFAPPLLAQDSAPPPTGPTLLERAQAVASPQNWPDATKRDTLLIPDGLTSDAARAIADSLVAKQTSGLQAQEAAWLAWHLVAMDAEAWLADGTITYRADDITWPQVLHLIYETPEEAWLADRVRVGYSVAIIIQERRDPEQRDALVEAYLGTGHSNPVWERDVTRYAAQQTLDEQIAIWDGELAGLLALPNPPQRWLENVSNRLVALTIRKRTQL